MVDLNSTLPLIEPLALTVNTLINTLNVLVGGVFGLYVIILIFRIVTFRKLSGKMNHIIDEVGVLKKKLNKIEKKIK
tara:strand:- start:1095 stop:1325 length:231 start_codon:yes stop_codon:yes gene_type:complete